MMSAITKAIARAAGNPQISFAAANTSVALLHSVAVPILAGTDACAGPVRVVAASGAGVVDGGGTESPRDVACCDIAPGHDVGLRDRGVVKVGKRADLVLVEGDLTRNVSVTRELRRAWVKGEELM